jgi:hypothetical protein
MFKKIAIAALLATAVFSHKGVIYTSIFRFYLVDIKKLINLLFYHYNKMMQISPMLYKLHVMLLKNKIMANLVI